jgi:imidazole glycerol-phosphate synthase subunit HisH
VIAVVDCGMGNIGAIVNMVGKAGGEAVVCSGPEGIGKADKVILPGVGAFDNGVRNLRARGLWEALSACRAKGNVPILGVCLGMQLFTESSEEGSLPGLGWLRAKTVRFKVEGTDPRIKVPHMGWSGLSLRRACPLLEGMEEDVTFYFSHSYHLECLDPEDVAATTRYGYDFPSVVRKGAVYATQFHPEKSHRYGLQVVRNFVGICK